MLMITSYHFTETSGTNFKHHQVIVSAWVLIPPSKQPSNFFCPPGTEILTSPPGRQKPLTIPIRCTYLTITLILILEQPTNAY